MDIAIQYPNSFRRGVQSPLEFRHIIVGLHGRVMSEQVCQELLQPFLISNLLHELHIISVQVLKASLL